MRAMLYSNSGGLVDLAHCSKPIRLSTGPIRGCQAVTIALYLGGPGAIFMVCEGERRIDLTGLTLTHKYSRG